MEQSLMLTPLPIDEEESLDDIGILSKLID
jgi:hypothetical protein